MSRGTRGNRGTLCAVGENTDSMGKQKESDNGGSSKSRSIMTSESQEQVSTRTSEILDLKNFLCEKLKEMSDSQEKSAESLQKSLEFSQEQLSKIEVRCNDSNKDLKDVAKQLKVSNFRTEVLQTENNELKLRVQFLEQETRRRNVIVKGVRESKNENIWAILDSLFSDMELSFTSEVVDEAYRIGNTSQDFCRPILVKFAMVKNKTLLFKSVRKLKDKTNWKTVWVSDDLTKEQQAQYAELRALYKLALSDGRNDVRLSGNSLFIGSRKYSHSDIKRLPHNLSLERATLVSKGDNIGYHSRHAFLSTMYNAKLTVDKVEFTSVEQGYQYHKACFMKDNSLANRILHTEDPYVCKKLGDSLLVTNQWNETKLQVMNKCMKAKFDQNPELVERLTETAPRRIVECTRGSVFGAGIHLYSPLLETGQWKGQNKNGELLMSMRSDYLRKAGIREPRPSRHTKD